MQQSLEDLARDLSTRLEGAGELLRNFAILARGNSSVPQSTIIMARCSMNRSPCFEFQRAMNGLSQQKSKFSITFRSA